VCTINKMNLLAALGAPEAYLERFQQPTPAGQASCRIPKMPD